MADERKRYSSHRAASAGGRSGAKPTGRDRLGSPGSGGGDQRMRRRRRADLIVWLVLSILAVATVAAAFTIPLAGQKDDAAASPKASSSPTPSGSSSPNPSPTSAALSPVTVADGGDVMGAWGVDSAIRAHGADYVLAGIKPTLQAADFAFFNLESPLSNRAVITVERL
jgi:hypothetical protein